MAQLVTTDPPGGATERHDLLATKFHVPRGGVVPRPRLLSSLAKAIGRGLTLVCTPAGFGKSTLLGDFARQSRHPTAWLSLDTGENDPSRFWRCCRGARRRSAGGRPTGGTPPARSADPPLDEVVTVVINDLSALPRAIRSCSFSTTFT